MTPTPSTFVSLCTLMLIVPATTVRGDAVLDWNAYAVQAIVTVARQVPPRALIRLSMVHLAIYDAVNAIDGTPFESYASVPHVVRPASQAAATAAAAHDVLVALFPAQAADLDAKYAASLDALDVGDVAKANGIFRRTAGGAGDPEGPRERWSGRDFSLRARLWSRYLEPDAAGVSRGAGAGDAVRATVHARFGIAVQAGGATCADERRMGTRLQRSQSARRGGREHAIGGADRRRPVLERQSAVAVEWRVARSVGFHGSWLDRQRPLLRDVDRRICGCVDRVLGRQVRVQLLASGDGDSSG